MHCSAVNLLRYYINVELEERGGGKLVDRSVVYILS